MPTTSGPSGPSTSSGEPDEAPELQRRWDHIDAASSEIAKRETVYADFVMSASNLLLNAYTHDEIALCGDEQRMVGLINRMRLFAPTEVVDGAEAVLRAIVEISLKPSIAFNGVRNSWLIMAKKSLFDLLADSASTRK